MGALIAKHTRAKRVTDARRVMDNAHRRRKEFVTMPSPLGEGQPVPPKNCHNRGEVDVQRTEGALIAKHTRAKRVLDARRERTEELADNLTFEVE